jgi:hypothetical protein
MEHKKPRTYLATLGDLELKTWQSNGRYPWSVTNSKTGEEIAHGEVVDLENAMVGAAHAAGAEWGAVRWRDSEEEDAGNGAESSERP